MSRYFTDSLSAKIFSVLLSLLFKDLEKVKGLLLFCRRFYHSLEATRPNHQRWSEYDKEGCEDVAG